MPPGDRAPEDFRRARELARKLASGPAWAAPGLLGVAILLLLAAWLAAGDVAAPAWEPWAYVLTAALLLAVAAWSAWSIRWARRFLEAWPDEQEPGHDT